MYGGGKATLLSCYATRLCNPAMQSTYHVWVGVSLKILNITFLHRNSLFSCRFTPSTPMGEHTLCAIFKLINTSFVNNSSNLTKILKFDIEILLGQTVCEVIDQNNMIFIFEIEHLRRHARIDLRCCPGVQFPLTQQVVNNLYQILTIHE